MPWPNFVAAVVAVALWLVAVVLGAVVAGALALACAGVSGYRGVRGGRSGGAWWWT